MNYLGVDTSAYTTSLAVVSEKGLLWETRRVLAVPLGETGLAQSAAFFQHVQSLPQILAEVPPDLWPSLAAVGVSMAPRPVQGSYMPVFSAGYAIAQAIAAARQIPLILTSHQEGHVAAGLVSAGGPQAACFLAVHLSGGTTELLEVQREGPGSLRLEILGGTSDLHAGQFVDRVGVLLGLPFPAGRDLEELALRADPGAESLLPSAVRGLTVSFSGVETATQRLIDKGVAFPNVARAVEGCVARTIAKMIKAGIAKTALQEILVVGGVSANHFIRQEIEHRLGREAKLFWAEPGWSSDNAIGVAFLTKDAEGCINTTPSGE
ncbi:MAG: tRNA (adenosine(37)-N6)-threonylcarbamoyltransferase complex transferase subunit TsaD [Desulfitobacteriaceae bacterium]